jgi:hypothetical protein
MRRKLEAPRAALCVHVWSATRSEQKQDCLVGQRAGVPPSMHMTSADDGFRRRRLIAATQRQVNKQGERERRVHSAVGGGCKYID